MKLYPQTIVGKWAAGLMLIALVIVAAFFILRAGGVVDFDAGHTWDLSVGVVAPLLLGSFVLSVFAIRREKTLLIRAVFVIGLIVIVFILTHSLFISD